MRWAITLTMVMHLATGSTLLADSFDDCTSPLLARFAKSEASKEVRQLSTSQILDHDRILKDAAGAVLIVRTNGERWAKLLVQSGRQRVDAERSLPVLLIERFVTFREGTERTVLSTGKNVTLYPGYRFSLDLGQIVPQELGGDLQVVLEEGTARLEPMKEARLYLLTSVPEEIKPADPEKVHFGDPMQPRFFNGTYHLFDDGRRSGSLVLKVGEEGRLTGSFVSEKDGQNYEIEGKIGPARHALTFTIRFPRVEEVFQGWLFTGDGQAIAGTSRILDREAGFYAVRTDAAKKTK